LTGLPFPTLLQPLFFVWIPFNILVAIHNLIPIPPLDGAKAWHVVRLAWRWLSARTFQHRKVPASTAAKVVSLELRRISKSDDR
jgi:stage IV sporulation protein FB